MRRTEKNGQNVLITVTQEGQKKRPEGVNYSTQEGQKKRKEAVKYINTRRTEKKTRRR